MNERTEITKEQKEALDRALNGRSANYLLNRFFAGRVLPIEKQDSDTKLLLAVGFSSELLAKCLYDSAGYDVVEEDETIVVTVKMKRAIIKTLKEEPEDWDDAEFYEGFDNGVRFILNTINLKIKGVND